MYKPSKKKPANNNARLEKVNSLMFEMNLDKVLRPSQIEALDWIDGPLMSGVKFMVLQMPTGAGKSIFSQYVIDKYFKTINSKANVDIVTATKILQKQYVLFIYTIKRIYDKVNTIRFFRKSKSKTW